mmetsp:Transcript_8939/g.20441  ORF Transcript_8939/g.20441 Transcript_8939/m.20441 type:complete len:212 (-) Transcript_8939:1687-2322(-)
MLIRFQRKLRRFLSSKLPTMRGKRKMRVLKLYGQVPRQMRSSTQLPSIGTRGRRKLLILACPRLTEDLRVERCGRYLNETLILSRLGDQPSNPWGHLRSRRRSRRPREEATSTKSALIACSLHPKRNRSTRGQRNERTARWGCRRKEVQGEESPQRKRCTQRNPPRTLMRRAGESSPASRVGLCQIRKVQKRRKLTWLSCGEFYQRCRKTL